MSEAQGNLEDGPFTVDDFDTIAGLVLETWGAALDRDWNALAGSLEWTCWTTADHTIDCVFSYALFLASRKQDGYPAFGELHALDEATPRDLVEGLRAVCEMLSAVIRVSPAGTRAIIRRRPLMTGTPQDFAARGAHELILHAHDVCAGLRVAFEPSRDVCQRLLDHTQGWGVFDAVDPSGDAWHDLLERGGRSSA